VAADGLLSDMFSDVQTFVTVSKWNNLVNGRGAGAICPQSAGIFVFGYALSGAEFMTSSAKNRIGFSLINTFDFGHIYALCVWICHTTALLANIIIF
jgi:hypothetical protein